MALFDRGLLVRAPLGMNPTGTAGASKPAPTTAAASAKPPGTVSGLPTKYADEARKADLAVPEGARLGYSPVGGGAAVVYDNASDRTKIAASGPGLFGTPLFDRPERPAAAPPKLPVAPPGTSPQPMQPTVSSLPSDYASAIQTSGLRAPEGAALGYSPLGGAAAVYNNASDRTKIAASGPGVFGTPMFADPANQRKPTIGGGLGQVFLRGLYDQPEESAQPPLYPHLYSYRQWK